MNQIIDAARELDGGLVVAPEPGSDFPELAWGDAFFYYAPAGQVPQNIQPYATIITKNYPNDDASDLDGAGRWRVNIHVSRSTFRELTGENPRSLTVAGDYAAADGIGPHPVYGSLGWVAVVCPGDQTAPVIVRLLHEAHDAARVRYERRRGPSQDDPASTEDG